MLIKKQKYTTETFNPPPSDEYGFLPPLYVKPKLERLKSQNQIPEPALIKPNVYLFPTKRYLPHQPNDLFEL